MQVWGRVTATYMYIVPRSFHDQDSVAERTEEGTDNADMLWCRYGMPMTS